METFEASPVTPAIRFTGITPVTDADCVNCPYWSTTNIGSAFSYSVKGLALALLLHKSF